MSQPHHDARRDDGPADCRQNTGLVPLLEGEVVACGPDTGHRAAGNPDPVWTATPTAARPDSDLVQSVQLSLGLIRTAADVGLRLVGLRGGPLTLNVGPIGRAAASITPGAAVERLRREPALAPRVAVRTGGEEVDLDPASIDQAFPHATDRVVVFVPGGDATEATWNRGVDEVGATYGSRLAQILGWTPVYVCADRAFSTRDNGLALSASLQRLVEGWPVPVRRIALVGHGTGGLVVRAACGVRTVGDQVWTDLVSDVIVLDTPHLVTDDRSGLPLDPVGLARVLDERLAGITGAERAQPDMPPLDHARYRVVNDAATTARHPLGRLVGGLVWWRQTATGRARQAWELFPTATHQVLSTREHSLANHPEVHRGLLGWLA